MQRVHSWLLWCWGPQPFSTKNPGFQSRNLLFKLLIFRWTILSFRGVQPMLGGIVFVGLHTEVLQHNCNHFSDEAARENPTAWASKIFWNFHPRSLGRWSHLTNIFEMGWFNHQLDKVTTPTNRRKVFLVSTIFTIGEQGLTNLRNWFWPKSNLERWWFCKNFEVDKSVVAMVSPWRRGLMLFRNCQVSMFLLNKHIPDEAKGRADSVGFADVSWLFSKSSIFFVGWWNKKVLHTFFFAFHYCTFGSFKLPKFLSPSDLRSGRSDCSRCNSHRASQHKPWGDGRPCWGLWRLCMCIMGRNQSIN